MSTGFKHLFRFFSDEERRNIHEASKQVLATTGLAVRNARARELLVAHGCTLDASTERVYLPEQLVEACRASFEGRYTFTAREPEFDVNVPGEAPCIVTASSASRILDFSTGEQRDATSSDIASIARLINELPGYDVFSISTLAADASRELFSVDRLYPALKYCQKPIRTTTMGMPDLLSVLEFGYALAGGREAYGERPFINHHYCPVISPLTFDVDSTEAVTYVLEQGYPVYATICPNGGMTSPMSMLGTLIVGNAEFLAINCYFQMVRPGTPVLYAYLPNIAYMRTGTYTSGSVECAMLEMAHTEMAEFYGVPSGGYIGQTDSHAPDYQAGQEVSMSATGAALTGASLLNIGGLLDSLVSFDYAKAVLDSEVGMNLKRLARGMEYGAEGLERNLREIDEVGPGGIFMMEDQTLENTPTICYYSDLASRDIRSAWEAAGSKPADVRAREQAQKILSAPARPLLSEETEDAIRELFPNLVSGEPAR
ncbi:MAG: trimethylamine methyltransferase family protein [Coriobacteriales bacterium]|jgi:trimethylamine--corrinoid protein Co-methyltransferase|nr:trimethylamine methyltransferase family protein [Coriobacteriales bacterium]